MSLVMRHGHDLRGTELPGRADHEHGSEGARPEEIWEYDRSEDLPPTTGGRDTGRVRARPFERAHSHPHVTGNPPAA